MWKDLRELIEDETESVSSARVGMWSTMILTIICISVDIHLSLSHAATQLPNTVYGILATMFTFFSVWAMGPRIGQYLGPQVGAIVQGISYSTQKNTSSTVGDITANIAEKGQSFVAHQWATGNPDEGII